jgi:rhamnosyltransferase subunit B
MKRKIIFATLGTRGDLYPFLGMAVEFRRQGYPVKMLGSEEFRKPCELAGVEFESVLTLEEHNAVLSHPDFWTSSSGLKLGLEGLVIPAFERTYRAIERDERNCALICNNIMLGALVAAEKFGLPIATAYLNPYSRYSRIDPPLDAPFLNTIFDWIGPLGRRIYLNLFERQMNAMMSAINDLRREVGLAPEADVFIRWRNSVPVTIDLWPDWYCSGKPDWPAHAVRTGFITYDGPVSAAAGWEERHGLRDFLAEKPIVFTMGSGMVQHFDAQVLLFSNACRLLGRKGLLVSTQVKGSVVVNDGFRIIDAAPFGELFSNASIIVSHGGIGTVARTLAAGRPTFIAPLAFDQFDNGHHISKIGAGLTAPFLSLKPKTLAGKLEALGTGPFRDTCQAIQRKLENESGIERAVTFLKERLLS